MFITTILPTSLSATTDIFIGMLKRGFLYQGIKDKQYLKTSIKEMWDHLGMKTRDDIAIMITTVPDKRIIFNWRDMHKKIITDKEFLKKLTGTQDIIINQE